MTMSLSSVHSELDHLSLRVLELSQDLITAKLQLEQYSREGFVLLAKARYSMGSSAVSIVQVPHQDNDASFDAIVKVTDEECVRTENGVRFRYFSVLQEQESAESNSPTSALTHRGGSKASEESDQSKPVKKDPLKWFGVLVPPTLRKSQAYFRKSTVLAVECANLQSELAGIEARMKFLHRTKAKLEKDLQAED